MLSTLHRPQRILEIGTFTGYSALCLAEGLSSDGELISIDRNDELQEIQEEFISQSDYATQIQRLVGDALTILEKLAGTFDLIFLDADKENYHRYLPRIMELSSSNTLLCMDNMLWEGKVLDIKHDDPQTESIRTLTEMIVQDERLEQVMLPVRDGLLIARVI